MGLSSDFTLGVVIRNFSRFNTRTTLNVKKFNNLGFSTRVFGYNKMLQLQSNDNVKNLPDLVLFNCSEVK